MLTLFQPICLGKTFPVGWVGWLRRLCGGLVAEAMWWVRNTENKAQLRLAVAGALPELGKNDESVF